MKKFTDYITENNEDEEQLRIVELSYFDFINLCDIYEPVKFKDKYANDICKIIDLVKQSEKQIGFSIKSNKYHFLAAIKDKKIEGIFYKQLGGNPDVYDDGYIIAKNVGDLLFKEMAKLGPYTTFSNISNIPSLKSQLSMGAKILCITDSVPEITAGHPNGNYSKEFIDENIKQLLLNEKIYYKDGDDKFFFVDENGVPNIKGLEEFLITHNRIELTAPKDMGSKIKVYFLFNKK